MPCLRSDAGRSLPPTPNGVRLYIRVDICCQWLRGVPSNGAGHNTVIIQSCVTISSKDIHYRRCPETIFSGQMEAEE